MSDCYRIENSTVCGDQPDDLEMDDGEELDEAYEMEWAEPLNRNETLSRDIGLAITDISKHNSFDKQDLIKLLKRTRSYIDDSNIGGKR